MKLSDLIIEHGPYAWDEHQQEPRPDISGQLCDAAALNELREELMAARAVREAGERFEVWGVGSDDFGAIVLGHRDCPDAWQAELETTDDQPTLAELNQRAGEHAEVCR